MTVTGVTVPSAAKICVMPTFLPMIPLIIVDFRLPIADFVCCRARAFRYQSAIGNRKSAMLLLPTKSFDFHVNARWQIKLHQRVDGLRSRIKNIHQAFVRADLKLLARFLIDVR